MKFNFILGKRCMCVILAFLASCFILTSCLKDDFNFDKMTKPVWEPNFSLPLVHSKLDLSKVLGETGGDSLMFEDPNHFLTLIYRDELYSQTAEDAFIIIDQQYLKNYQFSLPGGMNNGDSISNMYNDNIVFVNSNNENLDTLTLKAGILNFKLNTNINHNAKIEILMPTVTKNGVPLGAVLPLTYTGVPININTFVDLAGYKLVFDHSGGIFNKLPINYKITLYNIGSPDLSPYDFNFEINFQNLKYLRMYGYLNQKDYLFPFDTLSIDIFKKSWFGNFNLVNPKLMVKVLNSYGFPLNINFDLLEAYNPKTPANVTLFGYPYPFTINTPAYLGQVTEASFVMDTTNSNIRDAINITPHYLAYHFEGHANPSGLYTPNFVFDTSSFKVKVEMELPLHGRAWDFYIQDTVDFEFEKVDELIYANFKLNILNGFPIDAKIQVVITDSLYVPLDSLFVGEQYIVQSGVLGPDLKVASPTLRYTEINLPQSRLTTLSNARKLLIRARLNTTNSGNQVVKIYSDYLIDVRLAVQAQLRMDLNNY